MKKLFLLTIGFLLCLSCESSQTSNRKTSNANYAELYAKAPLGATPEHYKGGRNASVIIEEFADFQCPTCAVFHPVVQELYALYGDRIKIVFRNYPLPIHSKAFDAALAAEAAGFQGKFWDMQNLLFANQRSWATSPDHRKEFESYAQKIGLDVERFKADIAGVAARERVQKDIERGKALRINSTPTFLVNGRPLNPDETEFQRFRAIIDAELQKVGQK